MQGEIAIVGAGIGGLTAALSLHAAGFPVRVFESVPELRPLGVGINLLPHAVRELEELGLRPALEAAGVACGELAYYTKRGQRIWAEPRGAAAPATAGRRSRSTAGCCSCCCSTRRARGSARSGAARAAR